jgi:hypothetical protein
MEGKGERGRDGEERERDGEERREMDRRGIEMGRRGIEKDRKRGRRKGRRYRGCGYYVFQEFMANLTMTKKDYGDYDQLWQKVRIKTIKISNNNLNVTII